MKAVLAALPQVRDDVADVAQAALRHLQVRTRVSPEKGTNLSPLCDSLPLRQALPRSLSVHEIPPSVSASKATLWIIVLFGGAGEHHRQ